MKGDLNGLLEEAVALALEGVREDSQVIEARVRRLYTLLGKTWTAASSSKESSSSKLLEDKQWAAIEPGSKLQCLGERFALFDTLANYFQARFRKQLVEICVLTLGFLIAFEFYAHLLKDQTWLIFAALAMLLIAYALLRLFRSKEVQAAYLCARCVSESLRIQFFATGAGLNLDVTQQMPRRYSGAMHQVRGILAAVCNEAGSGSDQSQLDQDIIETNWIDGQKAYFLEAIERNETSAKVLEVFSTGAFLVGVLCILILAVLAMQGLDVHAKEVLLSVGPSLIVLGAIVEFFAERSGFKANAERYRNIVQMYSHTESGAAWKERVQSIASESLSEHFDWYVTSVEREIAIPKG